MRKIIKTPAGNYTFWAVVAAFVAFLTVGGFASGYAPTCDGRQMGPGDACVGTGGGSYQQLVDQHYLYDHIVFVLSFSLMIFFIVLAVRARRLARRARVGASDGRRAAARHRVATSVRHGVPGTGVWIGVGLLPAADRRLGGKDPVLAAESELARAVVDTVGASVGRDGGLVSGRHTWVVVTWCVPERDDRRALAGIVAAVLEALAGAGIDAEYAHVVPRIAEPDPARPNTSYYPHSAPGAFLGFGARIEFELLQPRIERSVAALGPRLRAAGPQELYPGGPDDELCCPVDHTAAASAADVYAVFGRAWKALAAGKFTVYAPIHAELAAAHRCPACPTEGLEAAPPRTLRGRARSTGRCPCCHARWLTGEPGDWACLEPGRLHAASPDRKTPGREPRGTGRTSVRESGSGRL